MTILKTLITAGFVAAIAATPALAHEHKKEGMDKKGHHYFEMLDGDSDGQISKDEYAKAMEEKFTKMDADQNGMLTHDEMKAAMKEMRDKHHDKMMEEGEAE